MTFDLEAWRTRAEANLPGWTARLADSGLESTLAYLGAVVLWPLVQAAQEGAWSAPLLLHKVLPAEEAAHLIEDLGGWESEAEGARRLQNRLRQTSWAPRALTTLLDRLDLLPLALQAAAPERSTVAGRLRQELEGLGAPRRLVQALEVAGTNGDGRSTPLDRVARALVGPGPREAGAAAAYRDWWLRQAAPAGLAAALLPATHHGPPPNLGQVFLGLDTRTWVGREALEEALRGGPLPLWGEAPGRGQPRYLAGQEPRDLKAPLERLPALAAAGFVPHLVLFGGPGSGKTTLLRYLVYRLCAWGKQAEEAPDPRLPGWAPEDRNRLPVYLPARLLSSFFARRASEGPQASLFLEGIHHGLTSLDAPAEVALGALEEGQAVLLLDGLEEVPFPEPRGLLLDCLAAFLEAYPENRCLVSARPAAYDPPGDAGPDLPAFELAPPSRAAAARLLERLLTAWRAAEDAGAEAQALLDHLALALPAPPSPLDLTLAARLVAGGEGPPEAPGPLYERATDWLLWGPSGRPDRTILSLLAERGLSPADLRRHLWHQAYLQLQGGLHPAGTWWEPLAADAPEWAEALREALEAAGSPLAGTQGAAPFGGPLEPLRHILAGAHLSRLEAFPEAVLGGAAEAPDLPSAVRLAALRLSQVLGDVDRPLTLAGRLLEAEEETALDLAAEVLTTLSRAALGSSPRGEDLRRRTAERLAESLQQPRLPARQRAARGHLLSLLGDPRPGVDPAVTDLAGMAFCFVPAGPFWMGSRMEEQPTANADEMGHEAPLPLDYPFWIGRYPVTVGQWRAFLEATGRAPSDAESAAGPANHPVTWVTWAEALAFCEWLNQAYGDRLPPGYAFQLPSEAEWEKAARGGLQVPAEPTLRALARGLVEAPQGVRLIENPLPRRRYPWGDDLAPEHANYAGTGLGGPTAVGAFPEGRSPVGAEDLAGNVWEWTRSLYRPYPYDPHDGRESLQARGDVRRVLRGGSFTSLPPDLRCAARLPDNPAYWVRPCGFRVVAAPR